MPLRIPAAVLALLLAGRAAAQEPVGPWDPWGRYLTGAAELQVSGAFAQGRHLSYAWGRMTVGGAGGVLMQRTELVAGLRAGETLVDRVMLGPQLSLAVAPPGQYVEMGRGVRAQPYLLGGGAAMLMYDLAGEGHGGVSPAVFAGGGLRLMADAWDMSLTQVEVVVQRRFGFADEPPQVYLRFGTAAPRARRRPPRGPDDVPPAPPPDSARAARGAPAPQVVALDPFSLLTTDRKR